MTLAEILIGFLTYGSGFALGMAVGIGFGVYISFFFATTYWRYRAVADPAETVRRSITQFRRLNDSLWEAEKLLEFPEAVDEKVSDGVT